MYNQDQGMSRYVTPSQNPVLKYGLPVTTLAYNTPLSLLQQPACCHI